MTVNYSKGSDYHTQRNNKVVPWSSCNTTSAIMALKQAGYGMPSHVKGQPEDALSKHLRTDEAYRKMMALAPWAFERKSGNPIYSPQEVHSVLEWGINSWIGHDADHFTTAATMADLLGYLDTNGGVMLSGRFPLPGGEMGHIVSLAGYILAGEQLTHWIIDDPYGDWRTEYRTVKGNDIALSVSDFELIFERPGGIWAHLIESA